MPIKKGSCLNEEYTEVVKRIHSLVKEAKEKYESLPECLKDVKTEYNKNGGNSLDWLLINVEIAACCFAESFGIEVDRS